MGRIRVELKRAGQTIERRERKRTPEGVMELTKAGVWRQAVPPKLRQDVLRLVREGGDRAKIIELLRNVENEDFLEEVYEVTDDSALRRWITMRRKELGAKVDILGSKTTKDKVSQTD